MQEEVEEQAEQEHPENQAEEQAEQEHPENQAEEEDLTPQEHERALKGAYKSFVLSGLSKADIDAYVEKARPQVKTLIDDQLQEMQSAKVIMTLWVKWKKPVKMAIRLEPEDLEGAQDLEGTGDGYIRIDMPFNSKMTEFFQGSDVEELLRGMFAHIKTQIQNAKMPESGFTIDQIMHLFVNFHELALTRGSSYIELPEWIARKKAVINPKNTD